MTPILQAYLDAAQLPGGPGMPEFLAPWQKGNLWPRHLGQDAVGGFKVQTSKSSQFGGRAISDHEAEALFEKWFREWLEKRKIFVREWLASWPSWIVVIYGPVKGVEATVFPTYAAAQVAAVRAVLAEQGAKP